MSTLTVQKVAGILRKAGLKSSRTHQAKITSYRTTGYTVCRHWRNRDEVSVSHDRSRWDRCSLDERDEMMGLYATVLSNAGLEFDIIEEYDGFYLIIKGAA